MPCEGLGDHPRMASHELLPHGRETQTQLVLRMVSLMERGMRFQDWMNPGMGRTERKWQRPMSRLLLLIKVSKAPACHSTCRRPRRCRSNRRNAGCTLGGTRAKKWPECGYLRRAGRRLLFPLRSSMVDVEIFGHFFFFGGRFSFRIPLSFVPGFRVR